MQCKYLWSKRSQVQLMDSFLAAKLQLKVLYLVAELRVGGFVGLQVVSSSGLVSVASTPYFPCSSSNASIVELDASP